MVLLMSLMRWKMSQVFLDCDNIKLLGLWQVSFSMLGRFVFPHKCRSGLSVKLYLSGWISTTFGRMKCSVSCVLDWMKILIKKSMLYLYTHSYVSRLFWGKFQYSTLGPSAFNIWGPKTPHVEATGIAKV